LHVNRHPSLTGHPAHRRESFRWEAHPRACPDCDPQWVLTCTGSPGMFATDVTDQPIAAVEDHLERLLAFEPTPLPVVSVYLNTQPDQHGRTPDLAAYLGREFKSIAQTWLAGSPARESFDQDASKILAYVADKVNNAAKGVALFACHGRGEFFEAVQLNAPVDEHRIYVYNQPHLFHLLRIETNIRATRRCSRTPIERESMYSALARHLKRRK
jgi:hypothetical protein